MIQLQVLNKILETSDFSLVTLNNLDDSFFSDYKDEFNFIRNHYETYSNVPDKVTFLSKFPDFDVINVHEPNSYLINELVTDKNKLILADTFNKVRTLIMNGQTDEAMSVYTKAADSLVSIKAIDSVDILQDTSRYSAYLDKVQDFEKYYIKTGFNELDSIIGGWDRIEELAVIAARTNQGKTWVLMKCLVAAVKQGLRVGLYSGEMSERKVGYRFDTLDGHISNSGLIKGYDSLMTQYKDYIDSLPSKYPNACCKVLTPSMISGPAGVNALKAFIEKDKLDILFIDQHSLLEDDRKAKNPVEKAANISRDLKNLQVMKKIPIIAVSQQNRADTTNGIDMTMISQSDRIGQDATVCIFIEKDKEKMSLYLIKSRDSENLKKLNYVTNIDKGQFTFIPEDDDECVSPEQFDDIASQFGEQGTYDTEF